VEAIRKRFAALNPYDPEAIAGSVLKIEDENFDSVTKHQRQLWCYAISAKRYALFTPDERGRPQLVKYSEHGLGHLLNPTDPDSEDRDWIRQLSGTGSCMRRWGCPTRGRVGSTGQPSGASLPAARSSSSRSKNSIAISPMLGR